MSSQVTRSRLPRLPWSSQGVRLGFPVLAFILSVSVLAPAVAETEAPLGTAALDVPAALNVSGTGNQPAADQDQGNSAIARPDAPTNINWEHYGNDLTNRRYQNIDQINPSNVSRLQPLWIFHTGVLGPEDSFAATPLVVNGTMYISTGEDDVFALDAATGQEKWAYHPAADMPPLGDLKLKAGRINRGVAFGEGKVYVGRLDAILVALDAATGNVVWKAEVEDWHNGYNLGSAPQYFDGLVIIGPAGGEFRARGHLDAFDAKTGARVWQTFTTLPGDTWAGDSWKTGGAPVWVPPALDPELGLVYTQTGNPGNDANGSQRAGMNLYANSVVAMKVKTGEVAWYFQEIHHDIWDYDATQTPVLFNLEKGGQTVPALGHCNKDAFYFILDRRTGKPLYDAPEKPVPTAPGWQHPWPTQPTSVIETLVPQAVKETPLDPFVHTAPLFTPPRETPQVMVPGPHGGCNWPPTAFSPRTKYVYNSAQYAPHMFQAFPDVFGGLFAGIANPAVDGMTRYGIVGALDTTTGKIAWKKIVATGMYSGFVAAGDLVFYGEDTGKFNAVNAKTGQELWSFHSDDPYIGGASAGPIAYAVNGKELIANAFGGSFVQAQVHLDNIGDAVVAFGLPEPSFTGPRIERASEVIRQQPAGAGGEVRQQP